MVRRLSLAWLLVLAATVSLADVGSRYQPTQEEVAESYRRADRVGRMATNRAFKLSLSPTWVGDRHLWYRNDLKDGVREYVLVDAEKAAKRPMFDHQRLAAALSKEIGKEIDPQRLQFESVVLEEGLKTMRFEHEKQRWSVDLEDYRLAKLEAASEDRGQRGRGPDGRSPDREWTARLHEGQVEVRKGTGEWQRLSKAGSFSRFHWAPDSKSLVAFRLIQGDRHPVHLIESSPKEGGRAKLHTRLYDLPGDKLDTYETYVLFLPGTNPGLECKVGLEPIMGGGQPWSSPPSLAWVRGKAIISYPIRGYQAYQVAAVDPTSGEHSIVIDEKTETFIDLGRIMLHSCQKTPEMIWRSERDGWGHLYLIDAETGAVKNQITRGEFVVRGVEHVDEDARQIWFRANGLAAGQDPYHLHFYRVNFDGSGLTPLTAGDGHHSASFSPGRRFLVTTWSRVDAAPVHELRRTDTGALVMELERADVSAMAELNIPAVERFVAKGRDGKTDIWGVVVRPMNYDPAKRYPVIENIYAGPHDAHVPKTYRAISGMQSLAELGFIVVQIDGMGTAHRGKAFHDVAWKNVADAGFPDRILWIRALAEKYPYVDASRVGIYGTSAGGQNAAGALLFHPDFYRVGVASCGCHDNRMDKQWWNEQWMGYPVGPHYEEQSNITNAHKLKGRLMLILGEMDTNVPPESTLRLVDALIKANKEFEFVMIPGLGHSDGGSYGQRKRRDFFVRHLHGVETPSWND
jgi:dienelactone hydrolase